MITINILLLPIITLIIIWIFVLFMDEKESIVFNAVVFTALIVLFYMLIGVIWLTEHLKII